MLQYVGLEPTTEHLALQHGCGLGLRITKESQNSLLWGKAWHVLIPLIRMRGRSYYTLRL